jgi:hypothetical protein
MANFQKAPFSLLQQPPAFIAPNLQTILGQAGTYNLFDGTRLNVPLGNTTWKGEQSRVIAVWGGDATGQGLNVVARNPIVNVTPVSQQQISPNLWAYIVTARPGQTGQTQLDAMTSSGASYCTPLPLLVLPEAANLPNLPPFTGGPAAAATAAIVAECRRQGCLDNQIAYILATTEHETNKTFAPVRETASPPHPQGSEKLRRQMWYYPYYGRGYVQLTLEGNYRAFGRKLGVDLVSDPDLAMQANIAIFVMVHGMMHGSFGHALTHYVNANKTDFVNARHSVNGLDQAHLSAQLAPAWLAKLTAGIL